MAALLKRLWHDPVWSKVLAGAILSIATVVVVYWFGPLFTRHSASPEAALREPIAPPSPAVKAQAQAPTSAASAPGAPAPSPGTAVQTGNCSPYLVGVKIEGAVKLTCVQ